MLVDTNFRLISSLQRLGYDSNEAIARADRIMSKQAKDAVVHDPATGRFAPGVATTPEDHPKAKEHHEKMKEHHAKEGAARGESGAKPPKDSHSEAASWHHSAAFNHGRAAE